MTYISREEIDAVRRRLLRHTDADAAMDEAGFGHPDAHVAFNVRPISEQWRFAGRKPAYRTARANVQYIWRDSDGTDRFGAMPPWFAQRRYDLRAAGLMLPKSAPLWASMDYELWDRIDAATTATGDPTAVSAWHTIAQLPTGVDERWWEWMVRSFIQRELVRRGAPVAYAVHALAAPEGEWAIRPHAHLVIPARRFRTGKRHGAVMPAWAGSLSQHWRLQQAWRRHCGLSQVCDAGASRTQRRAPWGAPSTMMADG